MITKSLIKSKKSTMLIIIIKRTNMKHIYLSKTDISAALQSHSITETEAQKLYKKVDCQVTIYNTLNK